MSNIIVGVKHTHDSSVSLIEDDKLIVCIENEKINNGDRYKRTDSFDFPYDALANEGLFVEEDCKLVIDGWNTGCLGHKSGIDDGGYISNLGIRVAPYSDINSDFTAVHEFNGYSSYAHLLGHIIGTYATSSFSANRESVYSLVWDGGCAPRVDIVDPNGRIKVRYINDLHIFTTTVYEIMALYTGHYKKEDIASGKVVHSRDNEVFYSFSIAGKVMSYISNGEVDIPLKNRLFLIYKDIEEKVLKVGIRRSSQDFRADADHTFMRAVMLSKEVERLDGASILRTIHTFLSELTISRLLQVVPKGANLIYSGGAALNIKWNSDIVKTGHFSNVWITPFPNDSGSSIGVACCENAFRNDIWNLNWSVYSGPKLIESRPIWEWVSRNMNSFDLGVFIAQNNQECVVSLYGKAEIGPRSLGHRSLLMSPAIEDAKNKLNSIKKREYFRPVAPICLIEDAREAFHLVKDDKYMLYDHVVKDEWLDRIPAVVHIDKTARVQTVDKNDSIHVHDVLSGFKSVTGYGIMCNTSANHNGKGFFPDIKSATDWAEDNDVRYVWANGTMFEYTPF